MSLLKPSESYCSLPVPECVLPALLLLLLPTQAASAMRPLAPNMTAKPTTSEVHTNPSNGQHQKTRLASGGVSPVSFKLIARQLIDNRTPAAYTKVESFTLRNPSGGSETLAWLVIGYAHILDRDYSKAIAALRQAERHTTAVGDYITYFLATSYAAKGDNTSVVQTLQNFDGDWPGSLLRDDASILFANASLALGRAKAAIASLEKHREPYRADIELALGRAYVDTGENAKAVQLLHRIYYETPTAPEADDAGDLLASIPKISIPLPSFDQRKKRADVFLQLHHYGDAAREYRALLPFVRDVDSNAVVLSLGLALRQTHHYNEAQQVLEAMTGLTGELRSQQLYQLIELACAQGKEELAQSLVSELRAEAPDATWINRGLLSLAAMYLRKKDYNIALSFYRQVGPALDDPQAHYGHWRATWLKARHSLREAKQDLEDQITLYPACPEVAAALYWLARLAETERDMPTARAYYQRVIQGFPGYYYAVLSNQRLKELSGNVVAATFRANDMPLHRFASFTPPSDPRVQKSQILQDCGLTKFAVRELQSLAAAAGLSDWITNQIAVFYKEAGRYDLAMETIKRSVPDYLGSEFTNLPQPYSEALFPRAYWDDLKFWSQTYHLDPFLVAAVIRQESEFNPGAVSRAKALGLMQVLPTTGRQLARRIGVPLGSDRQLLSRQLNLQLGTVLLRNLLEDYDGHVEYALAAYNAGKGHVQEWLDAGNFEDAPEFVESIPFTETREYVQAIVRNVSIYRRLYGAP